MAPSSGWYPDPAGSADLRYWDGQTWTRQTSAMPAAPAPAPAGPAVMEPPPIPQQSLPPVNEGVVGPRALPGSLVGRVPSTPSHGLPRTRNATFYGLLAGGVAVVAAAAFLIPPVFSSSHKHPHTTAAPQQPLSTFSPLPQNSTPADPGNSVPDPGNSTYQLPEEFAGYPRITDSRAAQAEAEIMQGWPVSGAHSFGIYGYSSDEPKAMTILQSMSLTPAGDASILRGAERGLGAEIPGLTWKDADPGDYGGAIQCGTTTAGTGGAICVFADATTFGFTFVMGDPSDAQGSAIQLRAESETTPATPQPAPPETLPETPPDTSTSSGGRAV